MGNGLTDGVRGGMMGAMEDAKALREYVRQIERALSRGDATERTHYPALQALLQALEKGVTATTEPKRIECGAPDFRVSRGQTMVGYVEAKDVGTGLDAIEKDAGRAKPRTQEGEQLKRYLESLSNLVLTDFLEFRWYVDGQRRGDERLARTVDGGKIAFDKAAAEGVVELLGAFYALKMPSAGTPKELSERMARLARMTRDLIVRAFQREPEGGTLHSQLTAFRETLIPDLGPGQFADMYAQTIAYGLFAARAMGNGGGAFTRQNAAWLLPKTNPFLRSLFNHIAGPDLDDRIAWLVDDLAQLLAEADMAAVLEDFGKRTKKEDPVVHFYETLLKEYDPKMRQMRGVYYTPEPVVSYIVRSVDYLLREGFNRPLGLADPKTLVVDPAAGTGTFLYTGIKLIKDRLAEQGQLGTWNDYVARYLLPRLFALELFMAPYAIAHLKLGLELQELGYEFASDQRLGVYLTNTLEEAVQRSEVLFAQFIADEANAAARIKAEEPIMVVTGNPPYFGHSANKGPWIGKLVRDYYQVDGQELGEKNPKWLQDDYVKFLRFGQWRIERTGQGILAFITNHGYLDNPTFRGMRQQLMNAFTDVYLLDLHGNTRKRERAPDGGPDENVFDIQQGVAIGVFVKEVDKAGPATVHHADLWGLREGKYGWLAENDVATTAWAELAPATPFYLFVPQDAHLRGEYERGWKITEVMRVNSVGVVTARDHLTIGWSADEVWERARDFAKLEAEVAREKYRLGKDVQDWKVSLAQKDVQASGPDCSRVVPILYRPFDRRVTYYTGQTRGFICRPRPEVMRHMLAGENLALITSRLTKGETFRHVQVTRNIAEVICMSPKTSNNGFVFPLHLYSSPQEVASGLFRADDRRPNLNSEFIADLERRLGLAFVPDGQGDLAETFGPEDVFHYIYGIVHSPTYRERYAEFLKIDFPRVPLTSDRKLFAALAEKGSELVTLHLMESPALDQVVAKFPVAGTDEVDKVRYWDAEKRVYINKTQYFEGVEPEVWGFHIGGYQVCEKWLKDRRGRRLSYDEVAHYQKIVVAIKETIRLMAEIDAVIPGWPIE
jgi:hypothetical protein